MPWNTVGNFMVSYSDFPRMANSFLRGMVVYILTPIFGMHQSTQRSV